MIKHRWQRLDKDGEERELWQNDDDQKHEKKSFQDKVIVLSPIYVNGF